MSTYDHKHPKGTKYTREELIQHRDNWYEKVRGNIGIANKDEVIVTDVKLFKRIIEMVPWNGTIAFLRKNNFAGYSFDTEMLDDLDRYLYELNDPSIEFIDPDLESLRVEFTNKTIKAITNINRNTFPTKKLGFNSVPEEWEVEHPEKFDSVVNEIHNDNQAVCDSYDMLVKTCIRKLGVSP